MGMNSTTAFGLGQLGSVFCKTAASTVKPPVGKVFTAITCVDACTFDVLKDDRSGKVQCIGNPASHDRTDADADNAPTRTEGTKGEIATGTEFPAGITIYGRWSEISTSGATAFIAYLG